MLIRVSGNLSDGRPFNTRVEAPDLFSAVSRAGDALKASGVSAKTIRAAGMDGKSSVYIGKVREKKASKGKK